MRNMLIVALVFGLGAAHAEPSKNPPVLDRKEFKQIARDTAECHMEAFKLRPYVPGMKPEKADEAIDVQVAFMDICMEAKGYVYTSECANFHQAGELFNRTNALCWRKDE